ncbi:acyl-CoA thioesterase [bacterium]|nr:acyl-CoA thioesterase [candidate division CSSED10-310 bacterium]
MNRSNGKPDAFELTIAVHPTDIDELGHVNNVVYLRWVQDVAVAHWRHAATPEQQAAIFWVVVRHEIDYRHPVKLGEIIIARTWVGASTTHTFERHTELLREQDGKELARARTLWCPIDIKTFRPILVGDDVRRRFSASGYSNDG